MSSYDPYNINLENIFDFNRMFLKFGFFIYKENDTYLVVADYKFEDLGRRQK